MSEENPYAPPVTDPLPEHRQPFQGLQLATPGERFLGSLIDGLISIPIVVALVFGASALGYMDDEGNMSFLGDLAFTVILFVLTTAIQFKFLRETGQTIGKKMAKTRIVTMDGRKPAIMDLVLKRYGFVSLLTVVPRTEGMLTLVDALFVFRKDRRCLHDLVAGTQVVKVFPGEVIS